MDLKTARSMIAAVHADAPAERLLFAQFRLWMAGFSTGDADYWNCALGVLLRVAKPQTAMNLHGEFHRFTRLLNEGRQKEIQWRFSACRCLCRDEFLVLKLIAASQRKDEDTERLAAMELLAGFEAEAIINASRLLAKALAFANFILAPVERLPVVAGEPHVPQSYTLQ